MDTWENTQPTEQPIHWSILYETLSETTWHLPVSQSVQSPNNANNANALTI